MTVISSKLPLPTASLTSSLQAAITPDVLFGVFLTRALAFYASALASGDGGLPFSQAKSSFSSSLIFFVSSTKDLHSHNRNPHCFLYCDLGCYSTASWPLA
ncbi:hypothetical protein V6N13_115493 [Hibiscus sabdariffa]|uniref:Uncharacterized protein n=1 Tax=Hibiscus sabdariffa TaxID=183260 RepID=A0ABR2CRW8_9ROSI